MTDREGVVGVLLLNVGTPDAPRGPEVRRYLREFLSDPRVLDIPAIPRWLLLHLVILPFRPKRSARAYDKIWRPDGRSPLLAIGEAFSSQLARSLGDRFRVTLGMRYGNPSIGAAIEELTSHGVDRIVVFPLFPQAASSSTGSGLEEVFRRAVERWNVPSLAVIPPFYDEPGLAESFAAVGRPVLADLDPSHVVFSFHGLPERHVLKSDDTGSHCLRSDACCREIVEANRNCYRAQCFDTARRIARAAGIEPARWTVSFQSRLGRDPWIRPHTDETVCDLARRGERRIAVFCPAFVADCLETLEEVGIGIRERFLELGGEDLRLVPSLNTHPLWVDLAARLVRRSAWGAREIHEPPPPAGSTTAG